MRLLTCFFVLIGLLSCEPTHRTTAPAASDNRVLDQVYTFALRGELDRAFAILDTMEIRSPNDGRIKRMYYERFISGTEAYDYKTTDTVIIRFVDQYHEYWTSVMVDQLDIDKADARFAESMALYLFQEKYAAESVPLDSIRSRVYHFSNDFLRAKGYFSNAFGKTGHLYDLFLWKKQDVRTYGIQLIDDSVDVTVHFMDDFITTGWSHYTTFGRSYAGGWANREALFCVASAYDVHSEDFDVSYLAHEGQHFADYRRYPKLQQSDLEYRAKLVELVKSKETTLDLIKKFVNNASDRPNNAHAFANYCVIRDLSRALFQKDYVRQKAKWLTVELDSIRAKSEMLFHDHSRRLDSIGREVVMEYIR